MNRIVFILSFFLFLSYFAQPQPDFIKINSELEKSQNKIEKYYKLGLKFSPRFSDSTFKYAERLIKDGEFAGSDSSKILGQILKGRGFYQIRKFDSANVIFKNVLSEISGENEFKEYFFSAKNLYGLSLWHSGDLENAKIIFKQLITEISPGRNDNLLSGVYSNLGTLNKILGDYVSAINDYEQAIKYGDGNKFFIANTFVSIGTIFSTLNEFPKADESFKKALMVKGVPPNFRLSILNNKAQNYFRWNKTDSAETYLRKGISLSEKLNPGIAQIFPLTKLSEIEIEKGKFASAEVLLARANNLATILRDEIQKQIVNLAILELKFVQKKYEEVIELGKNIIYSAEGTRREKMLKNSYKIVAEAYEAVGQIKNAHLFMKKHVDHIEKMNNFVRQRTGAEVNAKYNLEKMKNEVVSYKSRIKSNIYYIISLSFGGVAFVVLFLVAFKKYRGERKIAAEFDNDRKRQSEQIKKLTEKLKENKLADLDKKRFLFVNNKKIMFDDIIFIRSNGHYVNHYLEKKKLPVLERKNISAVCEELPDNQFVRVHRTTVINIFFIESFTSTEVLLTNGEKINVSRTYKNELQAALGNI